MTGTGRRPIAWRTGCAALAALFVLAGCGETQEAKRQTGCPRVLIIKDAERLVRFAEGSGRDVTDTLFTAAVSDFRGDCSYDKDEVDVDLDVTFLIDRGAALKDGQVAFDYVIALPTYYPAPEAKRSFPVHVAFERNQRQIAYRDGLKLAIPLRPDLAGADHEIVIGLKLTRQELDYNRNAVRAGR